MSIINLHLGDCMEVMKAMPDKAYSLAIVDPPYGINAAKMNMGSHPTRSRTDGHDSGPGVSTASKGRLNSGGGKLKNRLMNTSRFDWDNKVPSAAYFDELMRVSENQIIWGGNYFDLPPTRCVVCWDKRQPWENFSQWEMAWTSLDRPAALYSLSNTGGHNSEKKFHPTQKPVALYRWLLHRFAKPGDTILDTHSGSGSLALACHDLGFDLDAWEIDADYHAASVKRYNQHIQQLQLF